MSAARSLSFASVNSLLSFLIGIMNLNRKDTPAPFARAPQSPPRTPRSGTKRTSRPHKTPRDIYLEGLTDNARGADEEETFPTARISHDLSLTANTGRSSVVDNMLLSLNPDQPKFESPPYPSASRVLSSESPRARGHLPSSSLNSNYSFPSQSTESPPNSRQSNHHPRGRRSNSSNFQSLSRIDSLTTDDEKVDTRRIRAYQSQRAGLGGQTPHPASRSGAKSSKSSGSSSVDFGQMMRQSALARRSASFDDGRRRPSFPISSTMSQPIIYNSIEAAPTPTVPSGPRSPTMLPSVPPQPGASTTKKPFRNQGAKKSKSASSKGVAEQKVESIQDSRKASSSASNDIRPTSPAKDRDDLLAPQQRPPSRLREHAKERPGFFRRVFMSSRNNNASVNESPPQPYSSRNSVRDENHITPAPSKLSKAGSSGAPSLLPKEATPPTLAKKSSSFFRRRKRSISENVLAPRPIPVPHPDLRPPDPILKDSPSVSSLRELMNPYLSSSVESRKGSTVGRPELRFKPNEIPIEKSTIKPVFPPSSTHKSTKMPSSRGKQVEKSTSRDAPSVKTDTNLDDKLLQAHDQSFLHDNSSNETRLNATEPSIEDVEEPMNVIPPDSSLALKNEPEQSSEDQKGLADDAPIQSESPITKNVQPPTRWTPSAAKSSRSRADSEETFSMIDPGTLALAEATTVKETVKAAVTHDDTSPRVWLRPERSTEDLRKLAESSVPGAGAEPSKASDQRPTSSRRPRIPISIKTAPEIITSRTSDPRSPDFDVTLPFREDRVSAQRVFEGDEGLVSKAKAAAWLGEAGPDRARVRRAYMELFDWQNLNILAALRDFCGRLLLKGETQQVDRILDAFSSRWCACNPDHGFKATGTFPLPYY